MSTVCLRRIPVQLQAFLIACFEISNNSVLSRT